MKIDLASSGVGRLLAPWVSNNSVHSQEKLTNFNKFTKFIEFSFIWLSGLKFVASIKFSFILNIYFVANFASLWTLSHRVATPLARF
jgi:hypothetical protein